MLGCARRRRVRGAPKRPLKPAVRTSNHGSVCPERSKTPQSLPSAGVRIGVTTRRVTRGARAQQVPSRDVAGPERRRPLRAGREVAVRSADTTAATLFITNLHINRERAIVSHPHFDAVPTRAVFAARGVRDLHARIHVAARGRDPRAAIPDPAEARRGRTHARSALRVDAARALALRLCRTGREAGRTGPDEHARAARLARRVTRATRGRAREAAKARVRRAHVERVCARVVAHRGAAPRAAVGVARARGPAVNPGAPPVDAERGGRARLGAAADHPARRPRGPREVDAHPTSGCGRELRTRRRRPHRRGATVARATRRTTPTIVGRATDGLLAAGAVRSIART